jgi:hypothetical protein
MASVPNYVHLSKKIIFKDSLKFTGLDSSMYYESNTVFGKTTVVGTLHKMRIRYCSYYKDQAHYSRYVLTQGIELEGFIGINNRAEMSFVVLT